MDFEDLYAMLAKNIIYEMKSKKQNVIKKFLQNFSCKSSCAIAEEDHFEIIMEHIKKLEEYKNQMKIKYEMKKNSKNKINQNSIV